MKITETIRIGGAKCLVRDKQNQLRVQQLQDEIGVVSFEPGAINVDNGILVEVATRMRSKPIYFSPGTGVKEITYSVPATLIPSNSGNGTLLLFSNRVQTQ